MPMTKAARLPSQVRTFRRYARELRSPVRTALMTTEETKSGGTGREQRGCRLKPFLPRCGLSEPGVEGLLFLLRSGHTELLQRGVDSFRGEVVVVAQHPSDPVRLRVAEPEFDFVEHVR